MSSAMTTVSATKLCDSSGNAIANATIYFQPVAVPPSGATFATSYIPGGGTLAVSTPVSAPVANGVFSIQLADTSQTNPPHVAYAVTCVDNLTGKDLLGAGWGTFQPTGGNVAFDGVPPNLAANITVQYGGPGPTGPSGLAGPVGPASAHGLGNSGRVPYQAAFWNDLSGFGQSGSQFSIVNGQIYMTGTTGDFNQYIEMNGQTNDSCVDFEVTFQAAATQPGGPFGGGGQNYGIALGRIGVSRFSTHTSMGFMANNDAPNGTLNLHYNGSAIAGVAQVPNPTNLVAGDVFRLVYSQRWDVVTFVYENYTQGTHSSITYAMGMGTTGQPAVTNSGKFAIWLAGGAYTVLGMRVVSRQPPTPYISFLGDSKTWGSNAGQEPQRFASLLKNLGPSAVFAGPGDVTSDLLADLPYILQSPPVYAVLCIGYNDVGYGVSMSEIQANYGSIVSQLQAAGSTVIHLLSIPSNANVTASQIAPLNAWIISTFSPVVDTVTGWSNALYLSSDNIHPNALGHAFVAQRIRSSGYIPAYGAAEYIVRPTVVDYPAAVPTGLPTGPTTQGPWIFNNSGTDPSIKTTGASYVGLQIANSNHEGTALAIGGSQSSTATWGIESRNGGQLAFTNYLAQGTAVVGITQTGAHTGYVMLGTSNLFTWSAIDYQFGAVPDTGLSRIGPGNVAVGNGSLGDQSGTLTASNFASSGALNLSIPAGANLHVSVGGVAKIFMNETGIGLPGAGYLGWVGDTGFVRTAAGVVALGNSNQGDKSGTFQTSFHQGPANAPSGSTSFTGWCFSQDGHISYANGSTWTIKV